MTATRGRAPQTNDDIAERRIPEILNAAEALVATHGYDGLRLRDVSREAGVSIGMIQHYFATRDELVRETMRAASERRVNSWSKVGNDKNGPVEQFVALLDDAIADRHRCCVWLETCAASVRHPELRDDVRRTQDAWREALRRVIEIGAESGVFAPRGKPQDTIGVLVALIDGLILQEASEDRDEAEHVSRIDVLREYGLLLVGYGEHAG
ncbi:MAG: TetR/AcrR family transcriptional regulator [Galactobacter sp.]